MEPPAPSGSEDDRGSEPIGPDDLTIMTPNGTVAEPESWPALVRSVLREPGGFGSADRHFQAKDVSFAAVVDALSQWMRGDRTFIDSHEWERLSF